MAIHSEKAAEQTGKAAIIDFIGGTAGGAACVYTGQPLDTVKVKMQTFPSIYNKGMTHCLLETYRKDGLARGLYAGTVPALLANVAENSVLFTAHGMCQKVLASNCGKRVEELNPLCSASSGFVAGFFSSFALCPTELIKCRLQAMRESSAVPVNGVISKPVHIGPFGLCRQIMIQEGLAGFFHGLTSTFAREMPGYFFFFGGYEVCKHLLTLPGETKEDIGPIRTLICGGVGGVTLWTLIFPADVVKSRIQVNKLNISFLNCLQDILRNEGIRALYNGLGPTVLRTFPATGALFLAYEYTKKALNILFP